MQKWRDWGIGGEMNIVVIYDRISAAHRCLTEMLEQQLRGCNFVGEFCVEFLMGGSRADPETLQQERGGFQKLSPRPDVFIIWDPDDDDQTSRLWDYVKECFPQSILIGVVWDPGNSGTSVDSRDRPDAGLFIVNYEDPTRRLEDYRRRAGQFSSEEVAAVDVVEQILETPRGLGPFLTALERIIG